MVEDQLRADRATSASGARDRAARRRSRGGGRDRPPRSAAGRACGRDLLASRSASAASTSPACFWTSRASSISRSIGSMAGGMVSPLPSGSSAPPIRSSSSGSPIGTRRGSSSPPSDRRTKASVIARAARLLGTRIRPRARPVFSRRRSGRSVRRPARRRRRDAAGWCRRRDGSGRCYSPAEPSRSPEDKSSGEPLLLPTPGCRPQAALNISSVFQIAAAVPTSNHRP